jgi:peroxiredoxin
LTKFKIYLSIFLGLSLIKERDIKKRVFFSLMITGIAVFFIAMLQAKDQSSPSANISPACESFGIQRFQEKKESIPFSLKDLNGNQVSLSDYKGKPVLLFFWATWCIACKEDIVLLEKFSVGKNDQLAILAIVIDGERKERVKRIIKENKITLPVLLVLKEKILDNYRVWGWVPVTFLIDREGLVVGKIVGQRNWSAPEAWSAIKEVFSLR